MLLLRQNWLLGKNTYFNFALGNVLGGVSY